MNFYFTTAQYSHFIIAEGKKEYITLYYLSIITKPYPNADAKDEAAQHTHFKIQLTRDSFERHYNRLAIINDGKNKIVSLIAKNQDIILNAAQKIKLEKDAKLIAVYQQAIKSAEQQNVELAKSLAAAEPARIKNSDGVLSELFDEISNSVIDPELRRLAAHPYFCDRIKIVDHHLLDHAERNKFLRRIWQSDANSVIDPCFLPDKTLRALYAQAQKDEANLYDDILTQSQSPSQRSASNLSVPEHDGTQDTCSLPDADVEPTNAKKDANILQEAPAASDKDEKQPTKPRVAAAAAAAAITTIGRKRKRDDGHPAPAPAACAPAAAAAAGNQKPTVKPTAQPPLKRQNAGLREALALIKSPVHSRPAAAAASAAGAGAEADRCNPGASHATTTKLKRN